jgi:hypothetical protein
MTGAGSADMDMTNMDFTSSRTPTAPTHTCSKNLSAMSSLELGVLRC